MESKLTWHGPFKVKNSVSEYFEAITPIGKIKIQFVNAYSNLKTEALLPGNPGEEHNIFNVGISFEKFPENNITFSESVLKFCIEICETWYKQKYQDLKNIFNTEPQKELKFKE